MAQIHQFKPTLYVLLFLGMAGFALAAQSSVALALGCGGVLINGYLVYGGRFRPIPRILANLVTIASMMVVLRQLMHLRSGGGSALDPGGSPVMIIGHFLVVLQLVKLWEQRLNRDYGQLLVLSLLLMVAATINTNLLAFGLLLVAYLFLALYCCLLFHLKVESDKAREASAIPIPADVIIPLPPRRERKQMARSMRRMASVVAVYALATAIITFLFFPRSNGNGMLSPAQFSRAMAQTGYNDHLSLDPYTSLQSDDQIIGHARITRNGRELGPGDTVYLRGVAMSWYQSLRARGTFQRLRDDPKPINVPRDTTISLRGFRRPFNYPVASPAPLGESSTFTQSLTLSPTGTHVLFFASATTASGQRAAMPLSLTAQRDLRISIGADSAVMTEEALTSPIEYEAASDDLEPATAGELSGRGVIAVEALRSTVLQEASTGTPDLPAIPAGTPVLQVEASRQGLNRGDYIVAINGRPVAQIPDEDEQKSEASKAHQSGRPLTIVRNGRTALVPNIPPEVSTYARRPEVGGTDAQGPLVARRDRSKLTDPLDEQIARNIERHLRTQFSYTMDISDARTRADLDPIVWFLSDDGRRGHCEYFAAAMALMCQSIGIQTRVVSGYRCDEYNDFSHRFVVRQSQAHAWVEILTSDGWRTYDPTSSRGADSGGNDSSLWQKVKHLFDWLESSYANNIIYYNNDSRENLIQSMEAQMTKPLYRGVNEGWITSRFKDSKLYKLLSKPMGNPMVWAGVAAGVVVAWWVGRRLLKRARLRKRVARIGLDALPPADRIRLAQQLGFYDDLLRLLERRQITRQAHQTPLEFARSLLFLPADVYQAIQRLTSIFYRVRFGQQNLSTGACRRLGTVISQIDGELGSA
jgi:Ca2+/Na+ antiporter